MGDLFDDARVILTDTGKGIYGLANGVEDEAAFTFSFDTALFP